MVISGGDNHAKTVFMATVTVYNRTGVTLMFLLLYAVPGFRKHDVKTSIFKCFCTSSCTIFARSDVAATPLFHLTILCSFYLRAVFIKLSGMGRRFCKGKDFEKSQFYKN